jgi:hypothetical protein
VSFARGRKLAKWHSVVTGAGHHSVVIRELPEHTASDGIECLVEADVAVFESNAIDDDFDFSADRGIVIEELQDADHISQAGKVQLGHQQYSVRDLHHGNIQTSEGFSGVDDQMREGGLQQG